MKNILYAIAILATASAFFACGSRNGEYTEAVEGAETAFSQGSYAKAQAIVDTLVSGDDFSKLDTEHLCRLSMIFMRLSENSTEPEVNVALAARCLGAAIMRDSDSTMAIVRSMSIEDQARALMLTTINEAAHDGVSLEDTIDYDE